MHNFLVFAGDFYHPRGGAKDLIARFDIYEEAKRFATKLADGRYDWVHVYSLPNDEIVFEA